MKIRIEFGLVSGEEDVNWYKSVDDFPRVMRYQGDVYEYYTHKLEHYKPFEYTFVFHITSNFKSSYWSISTFQQLFNNYVDNSCGCGAKYDRHAPNSHMFYCPKWKPKGEK